LHYCKKTQVRSQVKVCSHYPETPLFNQKILHLAANAATAQKKYAINA